MAALAVLAGQFGERAAELVGAVTNPVYEPVRDERERYCEHVIASLRASPWARVIKISDFTDNGVGLFYTTGPKLPKLARKYRPLVPSLCEFVLRPDTPPAPGVKDMIAGQLGSAEARPRQVEDLSSWRCASLYGVGGLRGSGTRFCEKGTVLGDQRCEP